MHKKAKVLGFEAKIARLGCRGYGSWETKNSVLGNYRYLIGKKQINRWKKATEPIKQGQTLKSQKTSEQSLGPTNMNENFCLRFPELAESIFDSLDNKSLIRCKEVDRTWNNFLTARDEKTWNFSNRSTSLHRYVHVSEFLKKFGYFSQFWSENSPS